MSRARESNASTMGPPPIVTSASGGDGQPLVITGSGFVYPDFVVIGGIDVNSTHDSSTQITVAAVDVPNHAPGAVDISVINADGQAGTGVGVYTYP